MINRILSKIISFALISTFKQLSDKKHRKKIFSKNIKCPILLIGEGNINISKMANFGVFKGPKFYFSYIHLEAREKHCTISIDKNVSISNSVTIISENSKISIAKDVLIGHNVQIYDSDFHSTNPSKRLKNKLDPPNDKHSVLIEDNCWIGANCIILKGVKIGKNSVIAANSTVTKNVPPNKVYGGSPAKFIKDLNVCD